MIVSDRRQFLRATGSAFAALAASGCATGELAGIRTAGSYGPLKPDPAALIDLPAGFTYAALSRCPAERPHWSSTRRSSRSSGSSARFRARSATALAA